MPKRVGHPTRWTVHLRKPQKKWAGRWGCVAYPPGYDPGEDKKPTAQSTGETDKAEALKKCAKLEAELNAQERQHRPSTRPTVLDVFDTWLRFLELDVAEDERQGRKPRVRGSSLEDFRKARPWLELAFGDYEARDVTGEEITEALERMLAGSVNGRRVRVATARKYLGKLGNAWKWVRANPRRSGIAELPEWHGPGVARGVDAAAEEDSDKLPVPVSIAARMLDQALGSVYHAPLVLLWTCGMRVEAALACNVGDVVRDRFGHWLRLPQHKTSPARDVPLLPHVLELLDLDRPDDAPLFVAVNGGRLRKDVLRQNMQRFLKQTGDHQAVEREGFRSIHLFDLHSLRRSFSTDCKSAGVQGDRARLLGGWAPKDEYDRYARNASSRWPWAHEEVERLAAYRRQTLWLEQEHQNQMNAPAGDTTLQPAQDSGASAVNALIVEPTSDRKPDFLLRGASPPDHPSRERNPQPAMAGSRSPSDLAGLSHAACAPPLTDASHESPPPIAPPKHPGDSRCPAQWAAPHEHRARLDAWLDALLVGVEE